MQSGLFRFADHGQREHELRLQVARREEGREPSRRPRWTLHLKSQGVRGSTFRRYGLKRGTCGLGCVDSLRMHARQSRLASKASGRFHLHRRTSRRVAFALLDRRRQHRSRLASAFDFTRQFRQRSPPGDVLARGLPRKAQAVARWSRFSMGVKKRALPYRLKAGGSLAVRPCSRCPRRRTCFDRTLRRGRRALRRSAGRER